MGVLRFGVGGWRERVDRGFDRANVTRIARSLGETFSWRFPGATILVGYDTRYDSERLAVLCGEVMAACGLTVVVSDRPCPLPALSWAAAHDPSCKGAVMMTASGHSYKYGGMLARRPDGGPVSEAFAEMVERQIEGKPTTERGSVERADFVGGYAAALAKRARGAFVGPGTPRVVVDPMYGAGVSCACSIFEALGCDVVELHNEPVSDFRGLHPNAREPWVDDCERMVRETGAKLGVVLDGDASRMGIIDETGRLVSQHDLAPLVLEHIVRTDGSQGRVVTTFASSLRLERQADYLGCAYTRVPGSFENVYPEYAEGDVVLGADERGGIAEPTHLVERDGIYAACRATVALLGDSQEVASASIDALEERVGRTEWGYRKVPLDPGSLQRLRNLLPGMNPGVVAGREPVLLSHADGLRLTFDDDSWLMLTTDPTHNGARVTAEATEANMLSALLKAGVEMANKDV